MADEKCKGCGTSLLLLIVVILQAGLTLIAVQAGRVMKQEWQKTLQAQKGVVHEVHLEEFWGPVSIMVPDRCSEAEAWSKKVGKLGSSTEAQDELKTYEDGHGPKATKNTLPDEGTKAMNFVTANGGPFVLDDKSESSRRLEGPDDRSDFLQGAASVVEVTDGTGVALRRLSRIEVTVCNQTRVFSPPRVWNRYFAMIKLNHMLHMGTPVDMRELAKHRVWTFNSIGIAIAICMAVKYCLKFSDGLVRCRGHYYIKMWHNDRSKLDLVLESFMLHFMSTFFTLALQIALCSVFLAFWRDDHFVMTFVPKGGFLVFFFTMMVMNLWMVSDRVSGWLASSSARCCSYFWVFWGFYVSWLILVAVPMVAYTIYSLQFNYTVGAKHWLDEENMMFSSDFGDACMTARWASYGFVVLAVFDLLTIIMHDLEKC